MKEKLYDVVIYEIVTGEICSVVGRDMPLDKGFYNAEKRAATADERCNSRYTAQIVEAGAFKKGDKLNGKR